jgi:hypothetical protein
MPFRQIKLEITSTSKSIPNSTPLPPPVLPVITMDGQPFTKPSRAAASPSGFQLVVIDPTRSYSDPASIRLNAYYEIRGLNNSPNDWMSTFIATWNAGLRGITGAGNIEQQLIFLATYGFDANMAPPTDMITALLGAGAGAQLQDWMTHVDWGSQSGAWVGFPANYIFVGFPALAFGQGNELFERAPRGPNPAITSKLAVTLNSPQ